MTSTRPCLWMMSDDQKTSKIQYADRRIAMVGKQPQLKEEGKASVLRFHQYLAATMSGGGVRGCESILASSIMIIVPGWSMASDERLDARMDEMATRRGASGSSPEI